MDWKAVNFDWNHARAFLVTAEEGSLTAAAQALGTTQPTLGRQVAALEEELNVVLFDRAGGRLVLTPGGKALLTFVEAMGESALHVSRVADSHATGLRGKVSISVSEVYAAFLLPPILQRLRQEEPEIEVEIIAENGVSDLGRREADIAVRNFRPEEPELIARRIRDDRGRLYATAHYLESIGNPVAPQEFSAASFIGFADPAIILEWLNGTGMKLDARNMPLMTRSYLVHWSMVKQGLGIGIMPEGIGDADPAVVRACPGMPPFEFPIWLVSHRELRHSRRIRAVFDHLAEGLQSAPN